jgi:hypothetical protein
MRTAALRLSAQITRWMISWSRTRGSWTTSPVRESCIRFLRESLGCILAVGITITSDKRPI